ncbi:MAG TPA: Na+/H+ antiporter NhaA [Saprospiraceae bacterium]|nr:Na+/H+ antiporter NhaA [Saprospiraceae bacterium]
MIQSRVDILIAPVTKFIKDETTGGILLFSSAVIAMIWANSPWRDTYGAIWHIPFTIGLGDFVISKDLHHWINDGLMAIFFFVIGLELKRELIGGELSTLRKAVLPLTAGVGGMIVPALIYLILNTGSGQTNGWGVPMATDIAFVLGILALLGRRIPLSLKVFLTALAIADDLGAVLVIAFFYTSDISMMNVGVGTVILLVMIGANLLGVRSAVFYGVMGIGGLWLAFMLSGVHATIAGVLAAFAIPARTKIDEVRFVKHMRKLIEDFRNADPNDNDLLTSEQHHIIGDIKKYSAAAETPLQRLEHAMHPVVAFIVMPVFALANAGIHITAESVAAFSTPVTLGVFFGLILGKFVGITGITILMVKTNLASLPENASWTQIYGAALLAGVGFTMSLFITALAFTDPTQVEQSKIGILAASFVAGTGGYLLLRVSRRTRASN